MRALVSFTLQRNSRANMRRRRLFGLFDAANPVQVDTYALGVIVDMTVQKTQNKSKRKTGSEIIFHSGFY